MEANALQVIWFILIAVLITGYFVLDGFDLGMGVLYPFLGKNSHDKAIMRRSVGPIWDGNEVWLLTAGGALFAAFPPAYATTFSGFYLAIMLVLFGLIIRAISLEFYSHAPSMGKTLDAGIFIGSLLPALLFGVAIGNVLAGIPMDINGDYTGTFFGLLSPFALACGLVGLAQMVLQGASWIAVKTTGELHDHAAHARKIAQILVIALFALATLLFFTTVNRQLDSGLGVLRGVFMVVIIAALILSMLWARSGKDLGAFLASSAICLGLVGLTAASLFPMIVPSTDSSMSLMIATAASSDTALTAMLVITCIGLPLVLLYHFIVYRTFKGKITDADLGAY